MHRFLIDEDMLGDDLYLAVIFAVRSDPTILLEPSHDAHAAALVASLPACLGELCPAFDLEERGFLLHLVVLPVKAVRRDREIAHLRSARGFLHDRVAHDIALDQNGVYLSRIMINLQTP